MVKLSIAIPTYNRAKFLKETIISLVSQKSENIEIVISNNGSTDTTFDYLDKLQKTCSFLTAVHLKENQGIDNNIINVLSHCRGEYIAFLADDDLHLPGTIAQIQKALSYYSPKILYLNHFPFYQDDIRKTEPPFLKQEIKVFEKGEEFFKYVGLGFLSSLVISREEAIKHLDKVHFGRESAHLEIGARVSLITEGPFVFLGTVSVAARAVENLRYNPINSCILYQKKCLDDLLKDNLLSSSSYSLLVNRLVFKDTLKILLKMRIEKKEKKELFSQFRKAFRGLLLQQAFVLFLLFLPVVFKNKLTYLTKRIWVLIRRVRCSANL